MKIRFSILFCILVSTAFTVHSQNKIPQIKYVNIKDGIYINYTDFLNQKPILKTDVITTEFNLDEDFFQWILNELKLYYFENEKINNIEVNKIWAYAQDNCLYINYKSEFHKLCYLGKISPLISSEETTVSSFNTPYGFSNNSLHFSYNQMNSYYVPQEQIKIETIQVLYDFESKAFYKFTRKKVLEILQRDSLLHEEFKSLNKRKQRKKMYSFIRKYNERNKININ